MRWGRGRGQDGRRHCELRHQGLCVLGKEEEWGLVDGRVWPDGRGWLPVAVGRIWHVGGKVMGLKSYPCQVMSEPQFLPL